MRPVISNGPWLSKVCSFDVANSASRASSGHCGWLTSGVDADDADLALAQFDRVAVDHAGMAAASPAAGKMLVDPLRRHRQHPDWLDQRRIDRRPDAQQDSTKDERPQRGKTSPDGAAASFDGSRITPLHRPLLSRRASRRNPSLTQ